MVQSIRDVATQKLVANLLQARADLATIEAGSFHERLQLSRIKNMEAELVRRNVAVPQV